MTKARTKANRKYNEKAYDRLYITVPKGDKEKIEARAHEAGHDSINGYVNSLIERDKARPG
jgi:hypothetical protein